MNIEKIPEKEAKIFNFIKEFGEDLYEKSTNFMAKSMKRGTVEERFLYALQRIKSKEKCLAEQMIIGSSFPASEAGKYKRDFEGDCSIIKFLEANEAERKAIVKRLEDEAPTDEY